MSGRYSRFVQNWYFSLGQKGNFKESV